MNSYNKSAYTVQIFSLLIIIGIVSLNIARWFNPSIYKLFMSLDGYGNWDFEHFSLGQKISGFVVDSIGTALLVYVLILVIKLMKYIIEQKYFTFQNISILQKISKLALLYVLYFPISGVLLSIITTVHKGPGKRIISVAFSHHDIFNIMILCFMFIIITIFKKGYELEYEQKLTI